MGEERADVTRAHRLLEDELVHGHGGHAAARADAGHAGARWVAQVCALKNHATQTLQFCADQAVQILGGKGYMRGTASERLYREVKIMMIGGGAEDIMKDLAARQWRL